MSILKGEKVILRAFGERPVVRLVWRISDGMVLVTDEAGFAALQAGMGADIIPIGFPLNDVFAYDGEAAAEILNRYIEGSPIEWQKLSPISI